MTLFSEIYSCYYQIIYRMIHAASPMTKQQMQQIIEKYGYAETGIYLLPKLLDDKLRLGTWEETEYSFFMNPDLEIPLSTLQKSWLRSILFDPRIRLFLSEQETALLEHSLQDVSPLFQWKDFYYYDAFLDGDDYSSPKYQKNFRLLLQAIHRHQYIDLSFLSGKQKRVHYHFLPCKLEYSVKNDCFRLLALEARGHSHWHMFTINLARIEELQLLDRFADPDHLPNIDAYIRKSYHNEPVTLLIHNERNALERTMLQFANYQKNTTRLSQDWYQCEIYYNKSNETELLIEVLSFGPLVKVTGNEHFLSLLKKRLLQQKNIAKEFRLE